MSATTEKTIPGWYELLPLKLIAYSNGHGLSLEEVDGIESAASNISTSIIQGMAAIGDLQWMACDHPGGGPDMATIRQIGVLQRCLAELMEQLGVIESNAIYHKHELEKKPAAGKATGVSP